MFGFFKNQKVKDAVDTVVTNAVDTAKEVMAEATQEKMDFWGDVAKIGIFALLAVGAAKSSSGSKSHRERRDPDFRTMTVNNYYYGNQQGRK